MQSHAEEPTYLIFWLYNTTIWLHLMRCDNAINRTLEALGSLSLIEEILNSVFGMFYDMEILEASQAKPRSSVRDPFRGTKDRPATRCCVT